MKFLNLDQTDKNRIAVVTDSREKIPYGELVSRSNKLYAEINHRCLVFCLCENHIDSLCGYLGFLLNRVVPLMLDSTLDKELLDALILTYKPEYLWMPKNRHYEFPGSELIHHESHYCLIRLNDSGYYDLHPDLALLLTTSGSTGSPKLVRISYKNILSNAESISEYLGITDQDRPVTTLPMSYSFGLSIINSHFLKGATLLLTSRTLMEKDFWKLVREEAATTMSGVPYTYEMLKKLRFYNMSLPSLKILTQAGGKLNNDLVREFAEYSEKNSRLFYVMYGQTEATARMSYLPPEFTFRKLGSMGIAIPGGEFSLKDDKGSAVNEPDTIGELVYKGDNVTLGYAENGADLKKGDENNGILYTGDLAKRDSDNFYYIVGRKKRFIKIFGNRVNLDETERLLKNIVTDCACVGTDDHLIVYVSDHSKKPEIESYLTNKLGLNHIAYKVRHIDQIPKNTSGKTIYVNLKCE
jgi:long-chain acyl-CoA synthetase